MTGDNHHMEVFAQLTRDQLPMAYYGTVVSRLEATRRYRDKAPVIRRDRGPGHLFCFTLREGDMVEYTPMGKEKGIWRVRGVTVESNGRLDLSAANDARLKADIKASGGLERPPVNVFMKAGGWKVTVNHLGEVHRCHE